MAPRRAELARVRAPASPEAGKSRTSATRTPIPEAFCALDADGQGFPEQARFVPVGDPLDSGARTEILARLSLCTDLANGLPFETALRTGLLALRLARASGLAAEAAVFQTGLLRFLGCTGFAHEEARMVGGDDISLRAAFAAVDRGSQRAVVGVALREVGKGHGPLDRARLLAAALADVEADERHGVANCAVATRLAERLGAGADVCEGLADLHERWDSRGAPRRKGEEDVSLLARHVQVAAVAEHHHRTGGRAAAQAELRGRRGGHLDPSLVDRFESEVLGTLDDASSPWDELTEELSVVDAWARPASATDVAEAFADFVDLQSTFTLGHSRTVATLSRTAAERAGVPRAEVHSLELAALLHDLGRVSVPTGIWEKPGSLSRAEQERVRLHSYYTERVLVGAPQLEPLAKIAGAHHERVDGTGYPKGVGRSALPLSVRILSAADAYAAMVETRPHRDALPREGAARALREGVEGGRWDATAVEQVLAAAGHRRRPETAPTGLTEREVDVLRCVATGCSTKEAASELGIGARTVKHHIAQIYRKTGCSSRAGVALFAIEHGLCSAGPG